MVHKICPCGGELLSDGLGYCTYPPTYSHKCNKCGKYVEFGERYPRIEYIPFNFQSISTNIYYIKDI